MASLIFVALALSSTAQAQNPTTFTYNPANPTGLPVTWQEGQAGTNQCGTGSSQTSLCQNVFLNSITDFCLWAPPYSDGQNATIAETERIEVAYCLKSGYGTRLFPDGTILGAHWVQTPDYVQVTGIGDFTKIGIPAGDAGGELDPHGADGNGNPIGGLMFGNSFGSMQQYHEWTNFMSASEFCIRGCIDSGPNPANLCNHIYDTQGCGFNMPGNYDPGYFESCAGDSDVPMGQNNGVAAPSSNCVRVASLTSYAPASTSGAVSTSLSVNGSSTITYLLSGGPPTTTSAPPASKASSTTKATTSTQAKNSASLVKGSPYAAGLVALAAGLPILLL